MVFFSFLLLNISVDFVDEAAQIQQYWYMGFCSRLVVALLRSWDTDNLGRSYRMF